MRLYSFVAAATLLTSTLAARADILYGFASNSPVFGGTTFTVKSPDFLSYSSNRVAASGEYFVEGVDFGPIVEVVFPLSTVFGVVTSRNMGGNVYNGQPYNIAEDGVYNDGSGGSLIISGSPRGTAMAPTPEPSSFALLGTGLLGALGVARKRLRS